MDKLSESTPLSSTPLQHIALLGNSTPRRCGIATFSSHCFDALKSRFPDLRIDHYAMDDGEETLAYPDHVRLISQHDRLSYSQAAQQIEESGAQAIWLQHEFGIFGGPAGDFILHLLARTRLPLITSLHTVLETPDADQQRVMDQLLDRSSQIIVMADRGRQILKDRYGVKNARISMIEHGVPDRAYVQPDVVKPRFGWEGRKVILTFGLLAPDKGLDRMVRAIPKIVEKVPNALYVVLGATHPNIVREQGEDLRQNLIKLASDLGVGEHVFFINRYVAQEELLDYLQAADVYVTPYANPAQITSGTLSYAIAMGKPVVSTPYVHAKELLADDHGCLVPFGDVEAIGDSVGNLLAFDEVRDSYARRAYMRGRSMLWTELARRVANLLQEAKYRQPARLTAKRNYDALQPDLSAVWRMSDRTGILQHSILNVPDRNHGYCIDDNARALILMSQVTELNERDRDDWMTIYAAFVQHGWNPDLNRFRNFMSFDRTWCEQEGSEDSNGRTFWSLGITARDAPMVKHREWAISLYDRCIASMFELKAPRACAFLILGAVAMLQTRPGHAQSIDLICKCANRLQMLWETEHRPGWEWFESALSYDNMRLSEGMIRAGRALGRDDWIDTGLTSLKWSIGVHTAPDGYFRGVGTEGFGQLHSAPLPFDQQPLEAQGAIEAAEAAFCHDSDPAWLHFADKAYAWFLGQNEIGTPLARRDDGGCYDGLTPHGVNKNQGAESILALQLASCAMIKLSNKAKNMAKASCAGTSPLPA